MTALYKLGFLAEIGMDEILPANAEATWRLAADFVVVAAWLKCPRGIPRNGDHSDPTPSGCAVFAY